MIEMRKRLHRIGRCGCDVAGNRQETSFWSDEKTVPYLVLGCVTWLCTFVKTLRTEWPRAMHFILRKLYLEKQHMKNHILCHISILSACIHLFQSISNMNFQKQVTEYLSRNTFMTDLAPAGLSKPGSAFFFGPELKPWAPSSRTSSVPEGLFEQGKGHGQPSWSCAGEAPPFPKSCPFGPDSFPPSHQTRTQAYARTHAHIHTHAHTNTHAGIRTHAHTPLLDRPSLTPKWGLLEQILLDIEFYHQKELLVLYLQVTRFAQGCCRHSSLTLRLWGKRANFKAALEEAQEWLQSDTTFFRKRKAKRDEWLEVKGEKDNPRPFLRFQNLSVWLHIHERFGAR